MQVFVDCQSWHIVYENPYCSWNRSSAVVERQCVTPHYNRNVHVYNFLR